VEARLLSNRCEPWHADVTAEAKDGVVMFDVPVRLLDPSSLGRLSVVLPRPFAEGIGVEVARRMSPGGEWWPVPEVSGRTAERLWEIPAGMHEVRVSLRAPLGAFPSWTDEVRVIPGKVTVLRPLFVGAGSLRVRAPTGTENESMTIQGGGKTLWVFRFSSGTDLVLRPIAVGTYSLRFPSTGGEEAAREVTIEEGRDTLVDFGDAR
jgi:hypothetical protein